MAQQSLGYVKVVTPGIVVCVTINLPNAGVIPAGAPGAGQLKRVPVQSISFQALPGNAGIVYVGSSGLVRATGVEQYALVEKPVSAVTGPFTQRGFSVPIEPANLNAADYYIDADTGGDGVLVTVISG